MYLTIRTFSKLSLGLLCMALAFLSGDASLVQEAVAQESAAKKPPAAWYPRTEKIGPDEMFVVALGTGMPTPITRGQKSTAWYVELGNGDIFLFDAGSGSSENLFALRPDMHRVDKIFASHLQHRPCRRYRRGLGCRLAERTLHPAACLWPFRREA